MPPIESAADARRCYAGVRRLDAEAQGELLDQLGISGGIEMIAVARRQSVGPGPGTGTLLRRAQAIPSEKSSKPTRKPSSAPFAQY